ncbi:MAG: hypothetical protein EZS28_015470 [Streblomastix strix]|uniref:Uncharacterized protein n=1 Tax=Streblomastix strix TaxID=222440 RepID=A0A5J4W274_9EUKA|nr:MAG: hypothetical protein EZS28_015470 [Streblomastix strix]
MNELQPTLNQLQKHFNDLTSNIDEQTHSVKDLNKKSKISTIPPPISHSSNLISSSSLIDINKSSKLQSQGSFSSNSSSIPRLKQQKDKRPLHSKESENLLQNFAQQAYLNHNINNSKLGLSEKLQQHGRRKEDDQRKKSIEILGREQREKKKSVLAKIRNMHLPCEEIRQLINVDDELLMNQTFEQFNNAMQDF